MTMTNNKNTTNDNDTNNNNTNKITTPRHAVHRAKNTRLVSELFIALDHLLSSASLA